MQLRLHDAAKQELAFAVEWYEDQRAGLGQDLLAAITSRLNAIERNPRAFPLYTGRKSRVLEVRVSMVLGFPFTLPFTVHEELITVLAVAHQRRRPGYWQRRSK